MKKLIASFTALSLLALVAVPAMSATTADVTATVTVEVIAVSVSPGSVAYGNLALSEVEDTTTSGLGLVQTVTNDGNDNVDLGIKSSDAAGTTPWNLAASQASDAFTHRFSTDNGTGWTAFNVDNTSYSSLAASVASLGEQDFDLEIGMPTASSDLDEHTITVTVQATAS